MKYADFLVLNLKGEPSALLGSDGHMEFDGRFGLKRCINEAEKYMEKYRWKGIVGFEIRSGRVNGPSTLLRIRISKEIVVELLNNR
jgi:hypothetical protein